MSDTPSTSPRPYFLPAEIDYAALPDEVRLALTTLVEPAYRDLVLDSPNALERAMGATFTILLCLEIIDQAAVGREIADRSGRGAESLSPRDATINKLLRLIGAKDKAVAALMRLRAARRRERKAM